jgi:hypothetical protein
VAVIEANIPKMKFIILVKIVGLLGPCATTRIGKIKSVDIKMIKMSPFFIIIIYQNNIYIDNSESYLKANT